MQVPKFKEYLTEAKSQKKFLRLLIITDEPEEAKTTSEAESGQIKRSYLAKKFNDGEIAALYMIEQGPETLRDMVLHASGWVPTLSLTDWRFGENNDIDQISQEEAKRFAESVNLGGLVR